MNCFLRIVSYCSASTIVLLTLLGIFFGKLQRRVLPALSRKLPDALLEVKSPKKKHVALTIDDSPSKVTGSILDILKKHGATATFFVHTDQIGTTGSEGQALISRILREGHEIGNHMPRDEPSVGLEPGEFRKQFEQSDRQLKNLGIKPRWFRPAGAAYNGNAMMPVLREHGYHEIFVLGSFFPWDVFLPFPRAYARQIGQNAESGAILVLHDASPGNESRARRTCVTLEEVLSRLKKRGLTASKLSDVVQPEKAPDRNYLPG